MPALLARLGVLLGRFTASLESVWPALGRFFGRAPSWLKSLVAWAGMDTAVTLVKGTTAVAIQIAVMVCWATFIAFVFTGIAGLGLREIFNSNPFTGLPAGMLFLVFKAFPVKFAMATVTSYIVFRFTMVKAALVMARTMKFLFGA